MKTKRLNKNARLLILIFLLTVFSNDTALFGTCDIMWLQSIPRYFYLVLCVGFAMPFLLNIDRITKIHYTKSLILFAMMVVFAIVSVFNQESLTRAVIKELCILSGYFISINYRFDEYADAFEKVVYVLSVFSLFIWLIALVAPSALRDLPVISYMGGSTRRVRLGLLATIGTDYMGATKIPRAQSVFWEPSVYQIYINIALLYEVIKEKKNTKYIIVFVISLITTFSTAGIVSAVWLYVSYSLFGKGKKRSLGKNVIIFIGVLTLVVIGMNITEDSFLYSNLFYKFSSESGNGTVRKASLICGILISLEHPLTGVGMENIGSEMISHTTNSSTFRYIVNQMTNTYIYQFAAHGIVFGVLYLSGLFAFRKRLSTNVILELCLFVFVILILSSVNIAVSIIPYMLIFYGYDYYDQNRLCRNVERSVHEASLEIDQ